MKLFATCPSCTIEMWGWQRTCFACGAACRPSPATPPETRGRQLAMAGNGASIFEGSFCLIEIKRRRTREQAVEKEVPVADVADMVHSKSSSPAPRSPAG